MCHWQTGMRTLTRWRRWALPMWPMLAVLLVTSTFFGLAWVAPAGAQGLAAEAGGPSASDLAERGLNAYSKAQEATQREARLAGFAQAERLFLEAVRLRPDGMGTAELYANAGTAALRAERLGPAVLAFRRALTLDTQNAAARRNLAQARTLLPGWVPRPQSEGALDAFFFWHHQFSVEQRVGLSGLVFLLAAIAFAVGLASGSRLARGAGVLLILSWLGLATSIAVHLFGSHGSAAVLVAGDTIARASDSANSPVRFAEPLPAGTEVSVVEVREPWARVRLANEREAWVRRASLGMVVPSGNEQDGNQR